MTAQRALIFLLPLVVVACHPLKFFPPSENSRDSLSIVGGEAIDPSANPYGFMARLIDSEDGSHSCGAVLIREDWVLTAAHCVDSEDPEYQIRFIGLGPKSTDHQELLIPEKIVKHPLFERRKKHVVWDFALIKLKEKSQQVPLAVSRPDQDPVFSPASAEAFILGWGKQETGHEASLTQKLSLGRIAVLKPEACEVRYPGRFDQDIMICAGKPGKVDACSGDSGGPLFIQDFQTKAYLLIGLVSWGDGCFHTPPDYGAYARVSVIYDWIRRETANP